MADKYAACVAERNELQSKLDAANTRIAQLEAANTVLSEAAESEGLFARLPSLRNLLGREKGNA